MLRDKANRSRYRRASSIAVEVVVSVSLIALCTVFCEAESLDHSSNRKQSEPFSPKSTRQPSISLFQLSAREVPLSTKPLNRGEVAHGPSFSLPERTGKSKANPIVIAQQDTPPPEVKETGTTKKGENEATPKPLTTIENSIGMKLVLIPAGKFVMGSPADEKGRKAGEFQRPVTIKKPFYMGVYEVTQEQFERVMEENRSVERGPNLPVGNVSIGKAIAFCRRLSSEENQTYRLPTEAEWEYACRAGTTTTFHFGNSLTFENANFDAAFPYGSDKSVPALKKAQPVGTYSPNDFGLYDMHGNVFEWCWNKLRHRTDLHILRGGGAGATGEYCRSASRWSHSAGWQWTGFRVIRTVEPDPNELNIPVTHPLDQADRYDTQTLIAKVDKALAIPPVLLPGVVVFPAVDADRRIREDGAAIGWIANYAAAYTPHRRMRICLPNVRQNLYSAGCMKSGSVLNDESIRICLAASDMDRYVLPQLVEENGDLKLTFAVKRLGKTGEPVTFEHILDKADLRSIPGLIARGVLEQLQAKLDENEIKHLSKPQVRDARDLLQLSKMVQTREFGQDNHDLLRFVMRNPLCTAGWELYLVDSHPAEAALKRFSNAQHRLACDRLVLCAEIRRRASQAGLLKLLKLAPRFPNDPHYFGALTIVAMNLSEPELVQHALENWRDSDPSYAGCSERGRLLIQWAWKARRSYYSSGMSGERKKLFDERFRQAKLELEKAIEFNPLGWVAHTRLITVGMYLSLPLEYVDAHFDRAIELRPRSRAAYTSMYNSLKPHRGGNPDELLEFARICVETDFWEERIPEIGRMAIQSLDGSRSGHTRRQAYYSRAEIWDAILSYVEGAQSKGTPETKKYALNLRAKLGAYGGHFEEVVDTFRQLEQQGADDRVFDEDFTFPFLRDLVYSRAQSGQTQAIASLRVALDAGDFDQADDWLDKVVADSDETANLIKRSRRAIKIGRLLSGGRTVELSAQQIFDLFDGIDANWKVEGDTLLCRLPANGTTMILLPFGFSRAEVTGTLSWAESPQTVRIHSRTRTLQDSVSIEYEPEEHTVGLNRNGYRRNVERFPGDEASFRMTLDVDGDELEPSEDIAWKSRVVEDAPSGIGFQAKAPENHHAVFMLKNLRIQPLD